MNQLAQTIKLTDEDFTEYCKTLDPFWNTQMSRAFAEQFFHAGATALIQKIVKAGESNA